MMMKRSWLIILIIATAALMLPSWTMTTYGASHTTVVPVHALGATDGTVKVEVAKNAGDPSYPGLASNEQQIPFNGRNSVDVTFVHPDVGTYDYRITQIKGSKPDTEYDTSEYFARIFIYYDGEGKIQESVTLQKDRLDEKPDMVSFSNKAIRTTAPSKPTKPDNPSRTGDQAVVWIIYLAFMASLLAILIFAGRRRRKQG